MDPATPEYLFAQTTDIKNLRSRSSTLEVYVAIGGWTFSDNDTATQPVFPAIAADPKKRQTFADNLVSFMARYGFDGVDLDWVRYTGLIMKRVLTRDRNTPVLRIVVAAARAIKTATLNC